MSLFDTHLLSLVIFLPLLFAVLVAVMPSTEPGMIRVTAFIGMILDLGLALITYFRFQPAGPEFQLEYRTRWITDFGISYHIGVDGIAVSLLLLTAVLGPLLVTGSATYVTER